MVKEGRIFLTARDTSVAEEDLFCWTLLRLPALSPLELGDVVPNQGSGKWQFVAQQD